MSKKIIKSTFIKKHLTCHNILFIILSLFIVILSIFFSLNTKEGIPPDEMGHISLINRYYKSSLFSIDNPYVEHNLTASSREPSLYHASFGKLFQIIDLNPSVYLLRSLNIVLLIIYLFGVYLFLKELNIVGLSYHIFLILLMNSIMLPFLFASVNYDNLVNVSSIFLTLFFIRLWKKVSGTNLLLYTAFLTIGSMTKISFLPLALFFSLALLIRHRKNVKIILIRNKNNKLLIATISITFLLFCYFWFYNIIFYRNLAPKCTQLYSQDNCLENSIYKREQSLSLDKPLMSTPTVMDTYFRSWKVGMLSGIFGIFSHDSTTASPDFCVIVYYFLAIGIFLSLIYDKKRRKMSMTLLLIAIIYSAFVFKSTYEGYILFGLPGIARQGRYLFPILPLLYYLTSNGYSKIISNKYISCLIIIILFIFINQNSVRYVMHANLLKSKNYFLISQHKEIIETIDRQIPLVDVLLFWK